MEEPVGLFSLELRRPWLRAGFVRQQRMLSWALHNAGFQRADRVAWLEVHEAEVRPEIDVAAMFEARLAAEELSPAVAMMTSRNLERMCRATDTIDDVTADCAATVGLANAVRVGAPGGAPQARAGTVNLLAAVTVPLTDAALVEAVSIATEARTAALIDAALMLPSGWATGTGTDCIVVAAPDGSDARPFCGLHTSVGQALGCAVYRAVSTGARQWRAERDR